jgi:hypothetical protein
MGELDEVIFGRSAKMSELFSKYKKPRLPPVGVILPKNRGGAIKAGMVTRTDPVLTAKQIEKLIVAKR